MNFEQITTRTANDRNIACCHFYHKGNEFWANHNYYFFIYLCSIVVISTTKVMIFEQITTKAINCTWVVNLSTMQYKTPKRRKLAISEIIQIFFPILRRKMDLYYDRSSFIYTNKKTKYIIYLNYEIIWNEQRERKVKKILYVQATKRLCPYVFWRNVPLFQVFYLNL